jgi:hypothetical protein
MQINNLAASFTRPNDTTAYASGDLIANSVTAGSVVPMAFPLSFSSGTGQTRITRARFFKSGTTATLSTFRLHLYEASPTCANGDNGAWSTNKAANYLGSIDSAPLLYPFTDGCAQSGAAAAGSEMILRLSPGNGTTIYGLLEARAAYVPAAQEVFTITIECMDAY